MKKAQGANAAVLVAIIAGLIILYILFLPSEERMELLGENETEEAEGAEEEGVLLFETPGRFQHLAREEVEHPIPTVNLYTREEAIILKELSSIYVKNAWFDTESKDVNFTIKDPDNTKNVLMSFDVTKYKGRLIIRLNGHEIFNDIVSVVNVPPIKLQPEFLTVNNNLHFEVSGVGAKFWTTNEYTLQGFKITADITDISTRESRNVFLISGAEKENLEEVKLKFTPYCDVKKVGPLEILINNHNIFSGVPDCDILNTIAFSPFYVVEGENILVMKAETGHYIADRIKIETKLKEVPAYVYYFEISDEQMEKIEDNEADVNLSFRFVDDIEEKEADLIINGRKARLPRITDLKYSKDIDMYVLDGTNSLKIIPVTTFDIVEMKIEFVEK
ncbi:hypothetical protein KY361_01290 [Candidatus Woesearchaeota archaeon]|nr:hypothetical protein [Candidatus Woesearchaeota archaeon]